MRVEEYFVGDVEGDRGCDCTVCYGYSNDSAIHVADAIHERYDDLFTDDLNRANPGEYASLLRKSNNQDLEELEEFREMAGLGSVGDNIIINNPISSSDKFKVAFTGLMVLFLIIFIAFAVLVHKGVVHVPGVNPEALKNITKLVGIGLCVVSSGYSLLILGCIVGEGAESNYRKYSPVLNSCKSRLRKSGVIQKKVRDGLDRCNRVLQLRVSDLRFAITISNVFRCGTLLELLSEHLYISRRYGEIRLKLESVNSEIVDLRNDNATMRRESIVLAGENAGLYEENSYLRSRLDDLLLGLSREN